MGSSILSDTNLHYISIDVKDANGNTSQLNFAMQYDDSLAKEMCIYNAAQNCSQKMNVYKETDFEMNYARNVACMILCRHYIIAIILSRYNAV